MAASTKVHPTYSPPAGAPLRFGILKQLKDPSITQVKAGSRVVDNAVRRLFDFKPLVELTGNESIALENHMSMRLADKYGAYVECTNDLLCGNSMVDIEGDGPRRATLDEIVRMLSCEMNSHGTVITTKPGKNKHGTYGSLNAYYNSSFNLQQYAAHVMDIPRAAESLFAQTGKPVQVLDIGSNTAEMLFELKLLMGNRVHVHALGPFDEPHKEVDFYHMLTAERLPSSFREKFNLIVSNASLHFALLCHRALESIAESLAPGGVAFVRHIGCKIYDGPSEWESALDDYIASRPALDIKKLLSCGGQDAESSAISGRYKDGVLLDHDEYGSAAKSKSIHAIRVAVAGIMERADMDVEIGMGHDTDIFQLAMRKKHSSCSR